MLTDPLPGMKIIRTEGQEGIACAQLLRMYQRMGRVQIYSKIPSETYTTSWAAKRRNKDEGVQKGIPDYLVVTPTKILFIELKRTKNGVVSPEQKQWLAALNGKTVTTTVCKGFDEFKAFVDKELGI